LPGGKGRWRAGRGAGSAMLSQSHLADENPAGGFLFDALNSIVKPALTFHPLTNGINRDTIYPWQPLLI